MHRGRRRCAVGFRAALALGLAAALLPACSFEHAETAAAPDELAEHVPETELIGVIHTIVRDGHVLAVFHAGQMRNFPRHARTELKGVVYSEYNAAGDLVNFGTAERAVYHTEREDAELAGSIQLRSESQGIRLEAEALRWENERRRLVTGPGETVEFFREDGSQVRGTGLEVDVRSRTIRFSGPVSGTMVAATADAE